MWWTSSSRAGRRRKTAIRFPGSLGPLAQCGIGRTHALDGVAVVTSGSLPRSEEAIIDMCGPGSELSRFGRMPGLVVLPKAREGV